MNPPRISVPLGDSPLEAALLRGDGDEAKKLAAGQRVFSLTLRRARLMEALTARFQAGEIPFCQLSAVAQAAAALPGGGLPPVACCGAVAGNRCAAGKDYMLMLLDAWGVPALDLGVDVSAASFLEAVLRHDLRFALCAVFAPGDAQSVLDLHTAAVRAGVRSRFLLGICGAELPPDALRTLPLDCSETRAVPVAGWVVSQWKR